MRLPGFNWPEHEEHKEKVFHDMVFRPDEETLLVLWHRSWIWNRMGWSSNEAEAIKTREESLGYNTGEGELLCTEMAVNQGAIGQPRTIRHWWAGAKRVQPLQREPPGRWHGGGYRLRGGI